MDLVRFVLLGFASGTLYALIAQGLVLVYRGSGILNFAQGGFVMVGAYAYYQATVTWGLPLWLGLVFATLLGAVIGALVQVVILRHMQNSSALLRVISTLAVLTVLVSVVTLKYGSEVLGAPALLPSRPVEVLPDVSIGLDRIILFIIGVVLTVVLWVVYKKTRFGRATSAIAENDRVAASLGHSPERIATINWALGAAISGLCGALIAPITYLQPLSLAMLIIPALAVGLVADFSSFPILFGAAIGLGVMESLMTRYVSTPGWSASVPFLVVVLVMVLRGRGIPLRSHVLDRLPDVGSGRLRPIPVILTFAVMAFLMLNVFSIPWINAFVVTFGFAIICVSVVLVTGYAGQLSLAQYVLAGLGALVTARLTEDQGWPFLLALVAGVVAAGLVGTVVALISARTRGINLAVVTLGLGVVLFNLVLNNTSISGGGLGIRISELKIFGWDFSGLLYPERYGIFALALLVLSGVAVLNIRRGASGRRMLAVRSNERAAAALGVSIYGAKIVAFSIAAGLAALGGVVLAFRSASAVTMNFDIYSSILTIAMTVVGGVGYVGGGVMGGTLMPSGVGSEVFSNVEGIDTWLPMVSGLLLIFMLITQPSGLWQVNVVAGKRLFGLVKNVFVKGGHAHADETELDMSDVKVVAVEPRRLELTGVRVRFGNVVAVADATFTVEPGTVHGLIGPNGAGKTTVIDAVSGFVRTDGGSVMLDGRDITKLSPQRRLRAGLGRSFQSLELFEDLTMRENLAIACEQWQPFRYATDMVVPGKISLTGPALAAAIEFDLLEELDLKPGQLSMGKRRLAAIARAVATSPSVLCLDEPAAGLSDPESQHLAHLLRRLASDWGMGVMLVEHNIDMVLTACDTVTVLTQGAVLLTGPPIEVRNDPRVLSAYLGGDGDPGEGEAAVVGALA